MRDLHAGRTGFRGSRGTPFLFIAVFSLLLAFPLAGQLEDAPERRVDLEELRSLRQQVESNVNLEEGLQARVLAIYDEAIAALESARQSETRIADYERQRGQVGRMVELLREEVRQERSEPDLGLRPDATAEQVEARLTRERTVLEANRDALRDVEQLFEERAARRNEISRRLGSLDQEIDANNDEMRSLSDAGGQPDLTRARRRNDQNIAAGLPDDYDTVLADVRRRDHLDSTRAVSPLRPAADAVVVDTSEMSRDEVVAHLRALIAEQTGASR